MNTLTKFSLLAGMTGILIAGAASQANAYGFDLRTGVDANLDGLDDNFSVDGAPASIIPAGGLPTPYTDLISDTGWISTSDTSPSPGFYTFSTIFNLSDIVRLDTVELSGIFSVDNVVRGISLNGVDLTVPTQNPPDERGNFGEVFNLTISEGFQSGANTLAFMVENLVNEGDTSGIGQNPMALNVQLTGSAEVIPTPALLPGLLALGVGALRKKQRETAEETV